MSPWKGEGERRGLQGWDRFIFLITIFFLEKLGFLIICSWGQMIMRRCSDYSPAAAASSNCGQKGKTFTEPFDRGWGTQVNGASK